MNEHSPTFRPLPELVEFHHRRNFLILLRFGASLEDASTRKVPAIAIFIILMLAEFRFLPRLPGRHLEQTTLRTLIMQPQHDFALIKHGALLSRPRG